MRKMTQRTEAVISLDALAHNVRNIRSRLAPGVQIMAVLKGDAYGHGIAGIYKTLKACGVERYAVAVWEEGAALRACGAEEPVLLLGDTHDDQLENVISHHLIPTIFSTQTAEKLNTLAARHGIRQEICIKLDTGMSRIGFPANEQALPEIEAISRMENLKIVSAFSHFSRADEPDGIVAAGQLRKYLRMVEMLEQRGISIPLKHMANSPAVLLRPEAQLDAVRPGDILFALCPVDDELWEKENFRQVLHWYSYVALVKEVPAGTEVGYGGTYVTEKPTKIATIPVGFADGYSRRLSNRGVVKINGQKAPIIGRVCMDQFMVDVTELTDVQRGDTVALLDDELSILWMANLLDANVDEIVCAISKRVPRVYE